MIEAIHFNIFCASCFAMLGLLWILVDSFLNGFIQPYKISTEEKNFQHIPKAATKQCKSNNVKSASYLSESEKIVLNQEKFDIHASCSFMEVVENVDPNVKYLSTQNSNSTSKTITEHLQRGVVLKRPYKKISVPSAQNERKTLSLIVVKKPYTSKPEVKNNLVFSIKEFTNLINGSMSQKRNENLLLLKKYLPSIGNDSQDCNIVQCISKETCLNTIGDDGCIEATNMYRKRIKLDDDQIRNLHKTAQYIVSNLDDETKCRLQKYMDELKISSLFDMEGVCSSESKNTKTKKIIKLADKPNIIITELDSNDDTESFTIEKTQKKYKNKKKQRKRKPQAEYNTTVFSSKQCFERLAFFMSANKRFTQSKLIMEIEKELRPIKDQISELRDSMTDFSVISYRFNKKGMKSSMISIQPLPLKSRSTLTIPSASLQKLACIAEASQSPQICYPEVENTGKKLSPLAEMYIKLSRQ